MDDMRAQLDRQTGMLAHDPANLTLWRSCIDLATRLEDYPALRCLADGRLEHEPHDAEAQFQRAAASIGDRNYQTAIEELRALHTLMPDEVALNQNLGLCYYAIGQYTDAEPFLAACYAADVRSADLLRLLVSTYHHTGQLEKGVEVANENSSAASNDGALAGVYALLYLDSDDARHAMRFANYALRENAESIDGLVVDGTLRMGRLDIDKAKQQFSRAIELVPETGRAWVGLGTMALLGQDFDAARQLLRRGLEQMPEHVGSWHVLAWTELISGNLEVAQEIFQRALDMDRNFSESHGGLAAVAALRGDRATAEECIRRADGLDPECLSARFAESVLTGQAGNEQQARALILSTVGGLSPKDGGKLSELLKTLTQH